MTRRDARSHARLRTRLAVGLLALAAPACKETLGDRIRADAGWEAVTVLTSETAVLYSPFDEPTTSAWAHAVDDAARDVAELLEVSLDTPIELRLLPFEPPEGDDDMARLFLASHAGRAGLRGYASQTAESAQAVVYVPDVAGMEVMAILTTSDTLRHELFHALAPRSRLGPRARWAEEGLAGLVEQLDLDDAGQPVWHVLTPESVLQTRNDATSGDVAALLAWPALRQDSIFDPTLEGPLYARASSFAWFLMSRRAAGSFEERARSLLAMHDDELRAAEADWLEWQAGLDPLAEIARAAARGQPRAQRKLALQRMTERMLDPAYARLREPGFMELALAGLDHEETYEPACRFLLFGAFRRIPDAVMDELLAAPRPERRLLGQALRARRGEEVERPAVEQAEGELSPTWLVATTIVRAVLRQ